MYGVRTNKKTHPYEYALYEQQELTKRWLRDFLKSMQSSRMCRVVKNSCLSPYEFVERIVIPIQKGTAERPGLLWRDISSSDAIARIRLDKRGKEKIIPLNKTVLSMLDTLPRKVDSDKVLWFSPDGDYVSRVWRRAARQAGFPGTTLHDLNHTFYR